MKKPVYGFEDSYKVDEYGNIFSKKDNFTTPKVKATHASARQDRFRLSDKKYYDLKYLVYKSFNPESNIEVNDERIIFIDGNTRNCKLVNLTVIDNSDRETIALMLSEKYGERIVPMVEYRNYYISDNGEVYSYYNSSSKVLKKYIGTDGYYQVKIPDNFGADTHIKIHRWVAKYFVENKNPEKFNVVHHKDENKLNNNFQNLEWVTLALNTQYSCGKKCCMLSKDNTILSIHETIADLSRYYRVDSSTASKQCNGKKNCFTGGLKARFFDEINHNFITTSFD